MKQDMHAEMNYSSCFEHHHNILQMIHIQSEKARHIPETLCGGGRKCSSRFRVPTSGHGVSVMAAALIQTLKLMASCPRRGGGSD